jgi:hypothetical protein
VSEPLPNATEDDELAELDRLLRSKLIYGLKAGSPSASLMAVAQKFLAARKDQRPPARYVPDLTSIPFPLLPDDDRPAPATAGAQGELAKALETPWRSRLPFPSASPNGPVAGR